jgi:valyl-tRNA synthetase
MDEPSSAEASTDRFTNATIATGMDPAVHEKTVEFFSALMQLLHPFMPFVTEETYHQLKERSDDLCVKQFTAPAEVDRSLLLQGDLLKQTISAIRDARNKNNLKPRDPVQLYIQTGQEKNYAGIEDILKKQVNAETIQFTREPIASSISIVIGSDKFYIQTTQVLDTVAQKEQLQKELDYHRGFLLSVEKKLGNERFVQNAKPEVVEVERKKKADAEQKIQALEESLAALGN